MSERSKESASTETAISTEAESIPEQGTKPKSKVAKRGVMRKSVIRTLNFELSDSELVAKADFAGKRARMLGELEAEFDAVKAQFKGKIEKLKSEITQALKCVDERHEMREVEAEEIYDYEVGRVFVKHGYQVFESRDMTPTERQMSLNGIDA